MRALKGFSLFGGLAVVLTLFFVIGCSNNAPLQPVSPDPAGLGLLVSSSSSGEEDPPANEEEEFDSGLIIKSKGGEINIERGEYNHIFVVEAHAVEQTTMITVKSLNEEINGSEMIVFEFGPDGLEFSTSAKLQFEMAELNGDATTAKMYYYDPDKRDWVDHASASVSGGVAEFDIDHFSKYAISD